MPSTVHIDKSGRVVIPKRIREQLALGVGDALTLECENQSLTLRPVYGAPLRKEHGLWVFQGGEELSLQDANKMVRDAREQRYGRNADECGS